MSLETYREAARMLKAEVPGLSTLVEDYEGMPTLAIRYLCPCGDLSSQARCGNEPIEAARYIANIMKEGLRRHVIGEGNVPNFQ